METTASLASQNLEIRSRLFAAADFTGIPCYYPARMNKGCRVCRDPNREPVEGALSLGVTLNDAADLLARPSVKAIKLHLLHAPGLRPERLRPFPVKAPPERQRSWLLRELHNVYQKAVRGEEIEAQLRVLQTISRIVNAEAQGTVGTSSRLEDSIDLERVKRVVEESKRRREAPHEPPVGPEKAA
jgi:hypothetical protein